MCLTMRMCEQYESRAVARADAGDDGAYGARRPGNLKRNGGQLQGGRRCAHAAARERSKRAKRPSAPARPRAVPRRTTGSRPARASRHTRRPAGGALPCLPLPQRPHPRRALPSHHRPHPWRLRDGIRDAHPGRRRLPYADGVVVRARREHALVRRVPRDGVDAACAVPREDLQEEAGLAVPCVHFRVCRGRGRL